MSQIVTDLSKEFGFDFGSLDCVIDIYPFGLFPSLNWYYACQKTWI